MSLEIVELASPEDTAEVVGDRCNGEVNALKLAELLRDAARVESGPSIDDKDWLWLLLKIVEAPTPEETAADIREDTPEPGAPELGGPREAEPLATG